MKLAEILSGPEKWWRGERHQKLPGQMCLMIAAENHDRDAGVNRMKRILGTNSVCAGMDWNDAPERTWEEVQTVVEAYDRDRMLNP